MEKRIIYIAGEGHSGSTLLDIILGSSDGVFSVGELINLAQKGIKNREYCSCGQPVPECTVWEKIISEWTTKRTLAIDDYLDVQRRLITHKKNLSGLLGWLPRAEEVTTYIKDRELLYDIIFKYTDSDIIVDSSKSPHNIPILHNTKFEVSVIHLIRRFGDVLNSYKKKYEKNVAEGIEEHIKPAKTYYILITWILNNVLTLIYSRNLNYTLVKYEDLVTSPSSSLPALIRHDEKFVHLLNQRGPFYPKHLMAGNRIRMSSQIFISEKPMGTSYHRLNKFDKILARSIDFFY